MPTNENLISLVPTPDSSLEIEVPYMLGKLILKATQFHGQILFDNLNTSLSSGTLTLNVEDFTSKDPTLLCHFLEAMTLDYNVSDYPKKHVGVNNKLPQTGKNSPHFKIISASLGKPSLLSDSSLSIKWLIRGIEKDLTVPVKMSWDNDKKMLKLNALWKMNRSDFNIVVKKFLFIDADDTLSLKLELILKTNFSSV